MAKIFPLFKKLSSTKLSPEGMYLFWLSMGAYCEASRHMGNLVCELNNLGHTEASKQIREIEISEQHHGITLALAATASIKAAGGISRAESFEQERKKATCIFSALEEMEEPAENKSLDLVQGCVDLFHKRVNCSTKDAMYFLGVTYGVERLANTNIIPGEISSLIRSKLYGLTLEQPEMGYLREHAEECDGAEGWHETYMKRIIDEIGDGSAQKGLEDIEKATSDWYKGLYELITSV